MHEHGGAHHHHHHHHEIMEPEKLKALIEYMLGHNRRHAEELGDAAHQLRHLGKIEAAVLLEEAIEAFNTGNDRLAEAVSVLKEDN